MEADRFVGLTHMILGQDRSKAIAAGGKMRGGVVTTTMWFRADQVIGVWRTSESIIWVIDCLPAPLEQFLNDETERAMEQFLKDRGATRFDGDITICPDPLCISSSISAGG